MSDTSGARIIRDGDKIILYSNENTNITIGDGKIIIKGTIILEGDVNITTAADGIICGTSIATVKNGIVVGIKG